MSKSNIVTALFVSIIWAMLTVISYTNLNKKVNDLESRVSNQEELWLKVDSVLNEQQRKEIKNTSEKIEFLNKKFPKDSAQMIAGYVVKASHKYKVGIDTILALISTESNFSCHAKSHQNAKGMMQIVPSTGDSLCRDLGWKFQDDVVYDPEKNILLGTYYFSTLLKEKNGNLENTLAAYNGGTKASQQYGDYKHGKITQNGILYLPRETKDYVKSIFRKLKILKNIKHD